MEDVSAVYFFVMCRVLEWFVHSTENKAICNRMKLFVLQHNEHDNEDVTFGLMMRPVRHFVRDTAARHLLLAHLAVCVHISLCPPVCPTLQLPAVY